MKNNIAIINFEKNETDNFISYDDNLKKEKTNVLTKEEAINPIKEIYTSIDKNMVDVKLFIDQNIWDKNKDILRPNYAEKTEWLND